MDVEGRGYWKGEAVVGASFLHCFYEMSVYAYVIMINYINYHHSSRKVKGLIKNTIKCLIF